MKKSSLLAGIAVLIIAALVVVWDSRTSSTGPASDGIPKNVLPMYGAASYESHVQNRSDAIRKADEAFVAGIVEKKGSVKEALHDAIEIAWSYLAKGENLDAMRRCNQAWLIDHTSFYPSWCFGAVLGSLGSYEDSAVYFEQALQSYSTSTAYAPNDHLPLYRDAAQTFINLADSYLGTDDAAAKKYATKAIDLLTTSLTDVNLPESVIPMETFMLAVAHFNNGDFAQARAVYDGAVKAYPTYAGIPQMEGFDEALKEKGL